MPQRKTKFGGLRSNLEAQPGFAKWIGVLKATIVDRVEGYWSHPGDMDKAGTLPLAIETAR